MNYTEKTINGIIEKQQLVYTNLRTRGVFPSQSTPIQTLDETSELLLKLTYMLRVGFLEEFVFLFAYVLSKASLEKLIIDLEEKGYITSQTSRDLGKYFILTKQSLLCLTADRMSGKAVYISPDSFPSHEKLCTYKTLNGYVSGLVFGKITRKTVSEFKAQPKEARTAYSRRTYIKQFVYSKQKKGSYSKTDAETFADNYLKEFNSDAPEFERYLAFSKALKQEHDPLVWFSFLKDYFNSLGYSKTTILGWINCILTDSINNFQRQQFYTYRDKLLNICSTASLQKEKKLFFASDVHKTLSVTRRALLNSKTENKTVSELTTLKQTVEDIDKELVSLDKQKEALSEDFLLMLFHSFGKDDIPIFKEKLISLETLRQTNVFLLNAEARDGRKPLLTFGIMQPNIEELTVDFLFKRIEALLVFAYHHLASFEIKLHIFIYSSDQMEVTKNRLSVVREYFDNISTHYKTFLPTMDEITVTATKKQFKERYEIFRDFCF